MATTSKSPRKVLLVAYETARRSLKAYPHRFAPKKFTQHQLFACLVLKVHQKEDYRGITQMLADCGDLREAIGLKAVPHYTTLQKASNRLLRDSHVRKLLQATVELERPRRRVKHAAADSTGIETHHASRYFISRSHRTKEGKQPKKPVSYRRYGKLMILICCASHLILVANASAGPTPDIDQLAPLLHHVPRGVRIERLVADAGFDSASNHRLLREEHGILSTIPAAHGRPWKDPAKLPKDKYRRLMKTRFNTKAYRKRPQVETAMSMMKRNLGDCLRGRTYQSRRRDMLLMALTHNIAVLLYLVWSEVFYRALPTPLNFPAGTSFNLTHAYDLASNHATLNDGTTITAYTYSPANRLMLASANGVLATYQYDAAGNRTRMQSASETVYYSWDAAGRLSLAEPSAGTVSFTYNADGQRQAKQSTDGSVLSGPAIAGRF